MKHLLLLLGFFFLGVWPASAAGPSFDCAKAQSDTEWAICNTPTLSAWDARLAGDYAEFAGDGAEKQAQGQFLKKRNACVGNVDCLITAYQTRLKQIEGTMGTTGEPRSISATALARACRASDLSVVDTEQGDAGMSKATRAYLIHYKGARSCVLRGYPSLTVYDRSGAVQIGYPNYSGVGYYVRFPGAPKSVTLTAQSPDAWFSFSTSTGCDAPNGKAGIDVDVALPLSSKSLRRIKLDYVTCKQVTVTPIGSTSSMKAALTP